MKPQQLPAVVGRLLVLGAAWIAIQRTGAEPYNGQHPPGCSASALYATIDVVPAIGHIGDTVTFEMRVGNASVASACDQDEVIASYASPTHYPLGTTVDFGDIGSIYAVPVGEPPEEVALPNQNYTILAGDLENIGGVNFVIGLVRASGTVAGSTPSPSSASQTISVTVYQPAIQITKTCRLIPNPLGGMMGEATVTLLNTGDVSLRDLVVTDDAGTPGVPGDDFDPAVRAGGPTWPVTLGVGASTSRTYTFELTSSPYINTVKVTGNDGLPTSPGNEAAARVEASDDCELEIPRECPTRTIGYWFQHVIPTRDDVKCATLTAAFKFILDEDGDGKIGVNRIDLGFIQLPTADRNGIGGLDVEDAVIEALGFFHGKRSVAGDGSRDASCLARKRLALQLIGATANVLFLNQQSNGNGCLITGEEPGETYTGAELLEAARQAAISCDLSQISYFHGLLDDFNNSGDEMPFEDYGSDGDHSNDLRPCPVGRANKLYIGAHTYDPTTEANCACPE